MKLEASYTGTLGHVLFQLYKTPVLYGSPQEPKEKVFRKCIEIIEKLGKHQS